MLHVRRFVHGLVQRGVDVHVVSTKPDPIPGATFERFRIPPFGPRYPYRWHQRRRAYLRRLFRAFDVVNVQFLLDWGITSDVAAAGRLIARLYGSDVDPPPDAPDPPPDLTAARQELLRCADAVVAPSRALASVAERFADLAPSSIEVLHDGVDTQLFAPPSPWRTDSSTISAGRPENALVVGYYKGFKPVYDPLTLIESIPLIRGKCPLVRFDLVGDGPLKAPCARRLDELGAADAVRWIDSQPQDALPALLAQWDLVAVTSVKESFCVAALEAAAMQIPVVATRVGGLGESVDAPNTGLLVEPGNPPAFAQAVADLLKDPDRRRAMGLRARQRVLNHFEWSTHLDRWMHLLQRVARSHGAGRVAAREAITPAPASDR